MNYYIEIKDVVVQHYLSYAPERVSINSNGERIFRHVKQTQRKKIFTLYVDDVKAYKQAGGNTKLGQPIIQQGSAQLIEEVEPSWVRLSHISMYRMPEFQPITNEMGGHVIIKSCAIDDKYCVYTQYLNKVQGVKGLSPVSSMFIEYQQSARIFLNEKSSQSQMKIAESFPNRFSVMPKPNELKREISKVLSPKVYDSGIAIKAKIKDYCLFSYYVDKALNGGKRYSDTTINNFINTYSVNCLPNWRQAIFMFGNVIGRNLASGDFQCFLEGKYGRDYLKYLTKQVQKLINSNDKVSSKKSIKRILAKWIESGIIAPKNEWIQFRDLCKGIEDVQSLGRLD